MTVTAIDPTADGVSIEDHYTANGKKSEVSDAWVGIPIYWSGGYDETNVDFCRIVEVSDSGKTVLAKRCGAERVSTEGISEYLVPTDTYGEKFRLHVREGYNGVPHFTGRYPINREGTMDAASSCKRLYPYMKGNKGCRQTMAPYGH